MFVDFLTQQFNKPYGLSGFRKYPDELKNDLMKKTHFLPNDVDISERVYCYIHNLSQRQVCLLCNSPVVFPYWLMKSKRHYRTYCSNKCSNNSDVVQNKKKSSYMARYGVDNPSKSEKIKKRKNQSLMENYNGCGFNPKSSLHEKYKSTMLKKYNTTKIFEIPGYYEKHLKMIRNRSSHASKESLKYIKQFIERHGIDPKRCMFGEKEFYLSHKRQTLNGIYFYDLVVFKTIDDMEMKNKDQIELILEYDGAYWHPSIDQIITEPCRQFGRGSKTRRDIYRKDNHKELIAKQICPNFIRIRSRKKKTLP